MFHTIRKVKKYRKLLLTEGVRKRKKSRGKITKRDYVACEDPQFLSKSQIRNRKINRSVNVSGKRRRRIMKLLGRQAIVKTSNTEPMVTTQTKSQKRSKKKNKIVPVDLSTPEDSEEDVEMADEEEEDEDAGVIDEVKAV
ncbi:hypothetical protein SNE40_001330 [Patella caerulea]|uniref:Uncharacterized protein n=1 Tax=Patella caerulea TaxID=87958 RepID=A0AAN8KH98_PATCE